jgi:hypothetical protein
MPSFYITDALALGWQEIVARLAVNKPDWIASSGVMALWAVFLVVTLAAPFLPRMANNRTN